MSIRLGKSLVAILLIITIGGHWALLQSIAWVSMVVDYAKEAPIAVAIARTFDGKHPCNICKFVKQGKETEKSQEAIKVKTKLDLWIPISQVTLPEANLAFVDFVPFDSLPLTRTDSPPVPPPRRA